MLLRSEDEEASFGQLVDRNGVEVLKWMNQTGSITPTQYQSAFDSKGNLTAEAKNDLSKVLYQAVFKGANQQLEELFDKLPAKAQRAILSTAFRDLDSPFGQRMLGEIQSSVLAYAELMTDPNFVHAKKLEDVLRAVEAWTQQKVLDDRFESVIPADNYSNFALRLAAMYKASDYSQKTIATTFNEMYDLIQGTVKPDLFNPEPDRTPRTLAEAIERILGIKYQPAKNDIYNGRNGSTDVADDHQPSEAGERGSSEPPTSGEPTEEGEADADGGAGAAEDSPAATEQPAEVKPLFTYFQGSISELISKAKKKTQQLIKKIVAPVSNRLRNDLQPQGVLIGEGYNHVIDNNAILHTLKQHGGKNEEKRGQIPVTEEDIEKISDVVENYDEVSTTKTKRGDDSIVYKKEYSDGTVVYVEEVRTGRKELAAVTMWKTKKTVLTDANSTLTTQISDSNGFSIGKGSDFAGDKQGEGKKDEQIKKLLNEREQLIEASIRYQGKDFNSQKQRLKLDHEIEGINQRLEQLGYEPENQDGEIIFDGFEEPSEHATADTVAGEGYTIAPKPYTNKQGKTLDTYLVTFDRDFSKEEMSALRAKAKAVKGWYDRESRGWMLRSAEDAKAFAEDVMSKSEDEVADEAPLSLSDVRGVTSEREQGELLTLDGIELPEGLSRRRLQNIVEDVRTAYRRAVMNDNTPIFGANSTAREAALFKAFMDGYKDIAGEYSYNRDKQYLLPIFDHFNALTDGAADKDKHEPKSTPAVGKANNGAVLSVDVMGLMGAVGAATRATQKDGKPREVKLSDHAEPVEAPKSKKLLWPRPQSRTKPRTGSCQLPHLAQ